MNLSLKNKTYFVSGSSKGVGFVIAKALYEEGANVILNGRSAFKIFDFFKIEQRNIKKKLFYIKGDIGKISTINKLKKLIKKNKFKFNGIIANAGELKKSYDFRDIKDFEWYLNNNFYTSYNLFLKFLNALKKNKGNIVFISSIASVRDLNAPFGYACSKLLLNQLSNYIAKRYSSFGVKSNVILPGNILHPNSSWNRKLKKDKKGIMKEIKKNVPMNKFGEAKDIANIVTFLLSDNSKFINGSEIVADGGQSIK